MMMAMPTSNNDNDDDNYGDSIAVCPRILMYGTRFRSREHPDDSGGQPTAAVASTVDCALTQCVATDVAVVRSRADDVHLGGRLRRLFCVCCCWCCWCYYAGAGAARLI